MRSQYDNPFADLFRRIAALEQAAPGGNTAVSRGRTRFVGNESILVQGSGKVEGWWIVTGTQRVTGLLEGSGTLDWTGPTNLRGAVQLIGNTNVTGTLGVTGATTLAGAVTLNTSLTVGTGHIQVGPIRIDKGGAYGGRIVSSGAALVLDAGGSVIVEADYLVARAGSFTDLSASGTIAAHIKTFLIPHPQMPDHVLRHGATESPVSGVEYWGEETLPESGVLTVTLPDYFEALTKQDNRAVLVTARGFVADWGDITDGTFTVTGTPGGRFSWLVKAERTGADFVIEEPVYGPHREEPSHGA
mgnify:CR=1 FL=1